MLVNQQRCFFFNCFVLSKPCKCCCSVISETSLSSRLKSFNLKVSKEVKKIDDEPWQIMATRLEMNEFLSKTFKNVSKPLSFVYCFRNFKLEMFIDKYSAFNFQHFKNWAAWSWSCATSVFWKYLSCSGSACFLQMLRKINVSNICWL